MLSTERKANELGPCFTSSKRTTRQISGSRTEREAWYLLNYSGTKPSYRGQSNPPDLQILERASANMAGVARLLGTCRYLLEPCRLPCSRSCKAA